MADFGTCAVGWPLLDEWEKDVLEGRMPDFSKSCGCRQGGPRLPLTHARLGRPYEVTPNACNASSRGWRRPGRFGAVSLAQRCCGRAGPETRQIFRSAARAGQGLEDKDGVGAAAAAVDKANALGCRMSLLEVCKISAICRLNSSALLVFRLIQR